MVGLLMSAARTTRFFFFQAEDGIRDDLVTGVQTCALPISARQSKHRPDRRFNALENRTPPRKAAFVHPAAQGTPALTPASRDSARYPRADRPDRKSVV